jgi:DNA invertase Pin-like site-specific DNA recombinase
MTSSVHGLTGVAGGRSLVNWGQLPDQRKAAEHNGNAHGNGDQSRDEEARLVSRRICDESLNGHGGGNDPEEALRSQGPYAVRVVGGLRPGPPHELPLTDSRAALYVRVSTEDQDLAGQERDLMAEAERRGWDVVAIYDEKVSGTGRVERTQYDQLLRDVTRPNRGWSILFVWALDRWSREERFDRAVGAILDLEKAGVSFQSLKEPYLSTPPPDDANAAFARNLLLGVTTSVAAFESRRRSDRVRVAMREIREGRRKTRSGNPPGRPRRVTPEKAARILELRPQGLKWREIAGKVGLPAGTCASVWSKARGSNPGATAPGS